ncbi:hypothetical protein [Antarcticimicrobium sediminis]|uniref:Mu-like prophage FluMu N-terminal domain-containing protein n=1 Tax=Antarcticimicrobium sediminis TaxID=2546227 RepID=A0A4R5F0Q5_9RHOB|nr:hypothetical protein [Antarcticimicrobium sediminis]TDE40929.1 hypothetical protein E1B25_01575 [Antarcticimicrobium sediminis]
MAEKSEARIELETRAHALEVKFAANIGDETLAQRVQEAAEAAQDTAASDAGQSGAAGAAPQPTPLPDLPIPDQIMRVIGPKGGFRRAGRTFGPEPVDIPLEDLSEAEQQALSSEPKLIVAMIAVDGSIE